MKRLLFLTQYFYILRMIKEILLSEEIFEIEFLPHLRVFRSRESKNYVFSIWSLSLCVSASSITQKK